MSVNIILDSEPLALLIETPDGELLHRLPFQVNDSLSFAMNILADSEVQNVIGIPRFLMNLLIRRMFQKWQQIRLEEFKQGGIPLE